MKRYVVMDVRETILFIFSVRRYNCRTVLRNLEIFFSAVLPPFRKFGLEREEGLE